MGMEDYDGSYLLLGREDVWRWNHWQLRAGIYKVRYH